MGKLDAVVEDLEAEIAGLEKAILAAEDYRSAVKTHGLTLGNLKMDLVLSVDNLDTLFSKLDVWFDNTTANVSFQPKQVLDMQNNLGTALMVCKKIIDNLDKNKSNLATLWSSFYDVEALITNGYNYLTTHLEYLNKIKSTLETLNKK